MAQVPDDPETRLFVRFRDRGDVAALGELYDATAAELLRVAMHLVREPAHAEDLVQQTFVAAIEGAARFDAQRRVRAWLLGVLANLARKLHRDHARTPPTVTAEPSADPAALAAVEEFTTQVDAAIDTLPEVYRPVLVLHCKHGMIAAEIAHALRRPPGTVRTQLVRGLEMLKHALPASVALGAAVLCTPLRGIAAIKHAVLANAHAHVATLAAGATVSAAAGAATVHAASATAAVTAAATTTSVTGAMLMKKYVLAAAAVAAALVVAFAWPGLAAPAVEAPPSATPATPVQAALPSPDAPREPAAAAANTARDAVAAAPAFGALRCRFLWASDRTPAAGVVVHCMVWGRANPFAGDENVVTDANGEIALDRLEPGKVGLYVDREEGLTAEITAGATSEHTYLIPVGVTVDVAVQDEQGQPIPNARVWLSHYGNGTKGHEVAITNGSGRAVIRDVGEARQIAARADGYAPTAPHDVQGAKAGERLPITLTMTRGSATLRGVVLNPDGKRCSDARVWIGGFPLLPGHTGYAPRPSPPFELITDEHGRFVAAGVPAARVMVKARARGTGTRADYLPELAAAEVRDVELRLEREAVVHGAVRDDEGRAIAGAWVGGGASYGDFGYCNAIATADGSYRLTGLSSGRATISASADDKVHARAKQQVELAAGQERTLDLVLERSKPRDQVRGRVVDEQGEPLANWIVDVFGDDMDRGTWSKWLRTDADGRFVAPNCPFPQVRVHVLHPDMPGSSYPLVVATAAPGAAELELRVPATATRFATVFGVVVAADGQPVRDASVSAREPGAMRAGSFAADVRGAFRSDPLPPRRYLIEVRADGHPAVDLGERELAPDQQLDLGTIALPRGGHVEVTLRSSPEGAHCWAMIHHAGGRPLGHLDVVKAPARSEPLAPGEYFLTVHGAVAAAHHPFTVREGEVTPLAIDAQRGRPHSLVVREPRPGAWQRLDVKITDAAGRRVWGFDGLTRRGNEKVELGLTLGTGVWSLTATTDSGLAASTTLHVADVEGDLVAVVLDLR
jgi:RNA polymerase sigma-70 factor (ECF subfamily)